MAMLTTPNGITVFWEDGWMSFNLNAKGETFAYFFDTHPARPQLGFHWRGHELRVDDQGREWLRPIHHAVVDDFGFLVEVPA